MGRKIPVQVAGPVIWEHFQSQCPRLLGGLSRSQYLEFFASEYSDVWNDGAAWVLCKTQSWDHRAEVHVYSFDRVFRDKLGFFREILAALEAAGKHRVWTTLWPAVGHTVHRVLRELGFQAEGILRDYYQFELDGPFENAEVWSILLTRGEH